jgi:phosphoglycolate phosphatase
MTTVPRLKLLVFDLDGTLVDSRLDLANSVNATLARCGLSVLEEDRVISFVGDGAEDLLRRALEAAGLSQAEAANRLSQTLGFFLEHYQEHCLERTVPYPGVVAWLEQNRGYRKAVLTNKPLAPALRILEGLGLRSHFELVLGGDGPHPKKPDPGGLGYILSSLNAVATEAALIGDSLQDLRTARAGNCAFVAFLGGLGDPDVLEASSPDISVRNFDQFPAALAALEERSRKSHA